MAETLERIRRRLQGVTDGPTSPQTAQVTEWVGRHLPEVAWTTVEGVAHAVGTSTATVVRVAQRAGYAGYAELQAAVRAQLPPSELVWKLASQTAGRSHPSLLGQVVRQDQTNLEDLEAAVGADVDRVVDLLVQARQIHVTAALTTVPLAQYVTMHLGLLLGPAEFVEAGTGPAFRMLAGLTAGDVVIGVTFARYARATLEILANAVPHAATILVTDRGGPDVPGVTVALKLPAQSPVHFSSSATLMTLTAALVALLHHRAPERVERNLAQVDAVWSSLRLVTDTQGSARARPPSPRPS